MGPLDVFTCPLHGIRLVEASAGTGKTWAICGLVLRLLLERGLEVQRILVVTFTNAATAELRERIRERLVQTRAALDQAAPEGGDPFVPRLLQALRGRLADTLLRARLDAALASFDEASIFTIHGFCQRAVSDTPFTAQVPLALELVHDDQALLDEVVNDFWRREVAHEGLPPALAALLEQREDSPARWATLLRRHLARPLAHVRWPAAIDTAGEPDPAALQPAHEAARALWQDGREQIVRQLVDALPRLNATTYKPATVQEAAAGWDRLLQHAHADAERPQSRTAQFGRTLLQARTKKGLATPEHPFFDAAQALLDGHAALGRTLALQRLRLLRALIEDGGRTLREAKRRRRVVAFDDMLFNLHERLGDDDGDGLAQALRQRFPAALIDEFQDTDPLQWAVFGRLYGAAPQAAARAGDDAAPLFLVGDPKQAIYRFRNADLHTYLQARASAAAEYTLSDNQRATEPLIRALNTLFGANPLAFQLPGLQYHPVGLGAKRRPALVDRSEPRAPLQVWLLPTADTGAPLRKPAAQGAAVDATAAEIARLLAAGRRGDITIDERPLGAGDIAVLVRSHRHGALVRRALAALGVGSVERSQASVFHGPEAAELRSLLAALGEPARVPLLKAALATELMGLDAGAIDALSTDEAALLAQVQRLAAWRAQWLAQGIGSALRQWMRDEGIARRLLRRPDGERRLTNLLHLAECLQQTEAEHPGPEMLLRWIEQQIQSPAGDEAAQQRLESDANLVQIVTVHKSKGLEYPFVFCPFLWDGRLPNTGSGGEAAELHDDDGRFVIDYRRGFPDEFDEDEAKRRARAEEAAEGLRLVYVALTRAVHRCVLVAGGYASGAKASPAEGNHSLLNWLVAGDGLTPAEWAAHTMDIAAIEAAWTALAERQPDAIAVARLPRLAARALPPERAAPGQLAALSPPAHIGGGWRLGSYSALAHGAAHEQAAVDHDLRAGRAEALAADAAGRLTEEAERAEPAEPDAPGPGPAAPGPAPDDILLFPRGAAAGECVHAAFERADFTAPAHWPSAIAAALRQHGSALPPEAAPGRHARQLQAMLRDVLATPLPVGTAAPLRLQALPLARRLTELEFHLPVQRLDAAALNHALAECGYAVPRLGFGPLHGYLKGFIDLVFEHEGRFFVLDWKSNHLGHTAAHHGPAAVAAAMAGHGYHLQHLLYGVALERLLRRRLPDYVHERHFGGVLYLFVRGVRPDWHNPDGSPAGVYFHRAAAATLARLGALLDDHPPRA